MRLTEVSYYLGGLTLGGRSLNSRGFGTKRAESGGAYFFGLLSSTGAVAVDVATWNVSFCISYSYYSLCYGLTYVSCCLIDTSTLFCGLCLSELAIVCLVFANIYLAKLSLSLFMFMIFSPFSAMFFSVRKPSFSSFAVLLENDNPIF